VVRFLLWLADCFGRIGAQVCHLGLAVSSGTMDMSRQYEKFLFRQSRNFRFDEAWRNEERSCGCRQRIGIG
jgi:hypothetical protein